VALPSEHLFDKAGADALLPMLVELIHGLQDAVESDAAAEGREHLAHAGRSNGSPEAAVSVFEAAAEVQAMLDEIDEMGVILRDIRTGLCDFPAVRGDRPVYLCWRLGESEVGWWHPRDTGVAGRAPL